MYSCTFCDWSQNLTKKVKRRTNDWKADIDLFHRLKVPIRETDANFGQWPDDIKAFDYAISLYTPTRTFSFVPINTPKLKKMESIGIDKFDMVSCMYAIHYMMNNNTELDNFLQNVSENLLDQGYFIGTCLNGDSILNEMGSKNEIVGVIDNKTVFIVKKEDSKPDAYKHLTVGNKINVYFETFGSAFTENLVSISYLKERAKIHNLKLIEFKSFLEEPGNLLSMYEATTDKWIKDAKYNSKQIRNSNAMTAWAKLNCYFMFQKIRNVI